MAATLKSLAKATGFSITTVSRALGGFDDVNEETRRLILAEARRQGYQPNLSARALQKQRVYTLGIVANIDGPHFAEPFFGEFIAGVGTEASAYGFDLLISTQTSDISELEVYRRLISGRRVDALILLRMRYDDERVRLLRESGIPFAAFGRTLSVDEQDYLHLDIDGEAGQALLTEHFIGLGHKRIAYITPPAALTFTHYRICGYTAAMNAHGLTVQDAWLVESDLTREGGRIAANQLLELPHPPTAIMAGNDLAAYGVMQAVQERGLRVGQEIAVGGFDGMPLSELVQPTLTTVHQPVYEVGRQLAAMLMRQLAGQPLEQRAVLLKPELVIRASSGGARREDEK